jgi:hypothetical protein
MLLFLWHRFEGFEKGRSAVSSGEKSCEAYGSDLHMSAHGQG